MWRINKEGGGHKGPMAKGEEKNTKNDKRYKNQYRDPTGSAGEFGGRGRGRRWRVSVGPAAGDTEVCPRVAPPE